MKQLLKYIIALIFTFNLFTGFAQDELKMPNLKWYLSEDKSSYAGMLMVNQIWTRYISNNPDINGVEQYGDFDLGIRRSRLIFYTYLMDRVFIYTQIGADGMTYRSKDKTTINLYNAQTEFIVSKDKFHVGFGLNTWNGISRYANCKLLEFLVIDNPGCAYPVGGRFDKFGRQLGIYAKGTLDKFHYRVSLVKPFEYGIDSVSTPVTTERLNENFAVKGYFEWQFFDKENTLFPYMTMNNLGRAKMLNVGAGFYYHPEAMLVEAGKDLSTVDPFLAGWLISKGAEHLLPDFAAYYPSQISDILLASVDVFLDMPTKNHGSVTSYLGYYYNFFGKNYLRSMSKMNVSRMPVEIALPQGIGNSEWEMGTGHLIRGEFGYMLPGQGLKNRFQPYGAFTFKKFDALDEASIQFDAGINWLMYGHNIKWTLQYSSRPIYTEVDEQQLWTSSKGQVILQTQIYF
ncbi:MAG TPA: hypothetical protein VLA03_04515 [Draconibacterium sp.]|nr:hypothetical protein [Draconibacterium sp.]